MIDMDLTEAVDVAARAQWQRMTRSSTTFDELNAVDKLAVRSLVLPIVAAAAPLIAAQAWADGHDEARHGTNIEDNPHNSDAGDQT